LERKTTEPYVAQVCQR